MLYTILVFGFTRKKTYPKEANCSLENAQFAWVTSCLLVNGSAQRLS